MSSNEDRDRAFHEAAHALVAVRLGLPLLSTDIVTTPMDDISGHGLPTELVVTQGGVTKLVEGTIERCFDELSKAGSRKMMDEVAVMVAAGVASEVLRGYSAHSVRCRNDLLNLVRVAAVLDIGTSTDDPAVIRWLRLLMVRAGELLRQDEKRAWSVVATALAIRRSLSGDEVRDIVSGRDSITMEFGG